ncbi:DUF2103 domain-containing protein [Synechococcus sp. Nb3U1]|uniref:DUF2103 domain-containing protein n=1 Tax=Synechococcus sp. Nb3U1 TaxID=1914529 RepID=UPI001F249D66|nr:DUF2103 domain-containing protein [Synechococcus sp. Nb3U1]MCF2972179.1 DUF2103 domain-containing protein [Synechococcus sp. Nb3U1]
MSEPSGRLVWNHSTHISGLIPVLEGLIQQAGIKTVTPGALSHSRGRIPQLQLRVSVPIRGGYKLVARKGTSVQEVFVVTELSQPELETVLLRCLG